jgi:hypothetical protein
MMDRLDPHIVRGWSAACHVRETFQGFMTDMRDDFHGLAVFVCYDTWKR